MEYSDWAQAVECYANWGFSLVPVGANKLPLLAWKAFQHRRAMISELAEYSGSNLAVVTGAISGVCVIDCESREDAEWFWKNHGITNAVVKTRRGYHLYFRHPGFPVKNAVRVDDRYDVRGDAGISVLPPSGFDGGKYEWVMPFTGQEKLPLFKAEWRPETKVKYQGAETSKLISNGLAYISKIRAVQGSGYADKNTYRAACALKAAGMTHQEALHSLRMWNQTNAEPPWEDSVILHKINCVFGNDRV